MLDWACEKEFYCKYSFLSCGLSIYKDNPKRKYKGEYKNYYTHLKEADDVQPNLVWLDISSEDLDTR
jgi:hypothetical protein